MGVTNTWIAAAAGNWSDDANWSLGHSPIAGEDPTFDATSVNNCNANDSTPTGVLTIAAGYSGVITQSSDMYIQGFSQAGGTFTGPGGSSKFIYCEGSFTKTGGTLSSGTYSLFFTGENSEILGVTGSIRVLKVNGTLTVKSSFATSGETGCGVFVESTGNIIINSGYTVSCIAYFGGAFTNSGSISGMGTFKIILYDNNPITKSLSGITSNIILTTFTGGPTKYLSWSINDDINPYSLSIIVLGTNEYTFTLDLNGHNLTASSITVGARGILQCGEGTITTASLDSSAGTIIPETARWVFDGAATVNIAAGQELHSVIVKDRLKLLSNLNIEQALAHTNPIDLNGFALALDRPENEYTSIRRPMVRAIKKLDLGPMGALDRWMTDLGGMV